VIVAAVIESVVAGSVVHVSALSTNPNARNGSDGIELVLLKLPLLVLSCCRKRGCIKKKEGIPGLIEPVTSYLVEALKELTPVLLNKEQLFSWSTRCD